MTKKTRDVRAEDQIRQLRMELIIFGFGAAKEIARLKGMTSGVMECPLCQQDLMFSTAPNGHFRAVCATDECINAMEC